MAAADDRINALQEAFVLRISGADSPFECSFLQTESASYIIELLGSLLTLRAYSSMNEIKRMFSTTQQNVLYSIPENIGRSDRFWATPIVKGLSIAPAKPTWAAT